MMICRKLVITALALCVTACTQTTPSMMNNRPVELVNETIVEQVPLAHLNDNVLDQIAMQYSKNGTGPLELTMAFDPTSKSFTAMGAVRKLDSIKKMMATKGVKNVVTDTLGVKGAQPALMVAYDTINAQAPTGCPSMPGLQRDGTTRFIGDYQFGCSIETALAKQIAHPSDLQGNAGLGPRSGRREANAIDGYQAGVPREPLEVLGRENLGSD